MFPGIQFHRVDTSAIDASDRHGMATRSKAHLHNLSHSHHMTSVNTRESTEQIHALREKYDVFSADRSAKEARELDEAKSKEKETWKHLVDTNKALPNKLRGRHT